MRADAAKRERAKQALERVSKQMVFARTMEKISKSGARVHQRTHEAVTAVEDAKVELADELKIRRMRTQERLKVRRQSTVNKRASKPGRLQLRMPGQPPVNDERKKLKSAKRMKRA